MSEQSQKEQWIVVGKPKRKQIKKEQKLEVKRKNGKVVWETGKPLYSIQNVEGDLQTFMKSKSFSNNKQIIENKILSKYKKCGNFSIHIECLGLGDFIKFAKPRYQFLLFKHLLIPICQRLSNQISINSYDPIFSKECIQQVEKMGTCLANNIPKQKQGKLIILYMPHCQRFLYQRYCQIYIKGQVLVIGNSLNEYKSRCQLISEQIPSSFLDRELSQIKLLDFKQSINDTYCYYI